MSNRHRNTGEFTLSELREFASFPAQTQRYIRSSLDIAFNRGDVMAVWPRTETEKSVLKAQQRVYERLSEIRQDVPSDFSLNVVEPFMGSLIAVSAFDLGQCRLPCFSSYRFLYERLLGATVRPWLPGSFCAAASLPHLHPDKRKVLLQSISEAAATAPGWSTREPIFFPEWVDKVEQYAS